MAIFSNAEARRLAMNYQRHWRGQTGLRRHDGRCSGCGGAGFDQVSYSRDGVRGIRCLSCDVVKPEDGWPVPTFPDRPITYATAWQTEQEKKRFILWDPKDGVPRRAEDGSFLTSGAMGKLTETNVYLTAYPKWPQRGLRPVDIQVGECIRGVEYHLSGEKGVYDVYRVE